MLIYAISMITFTVLVSLATCGVVATGMNKYDEKIGSMYENDKKNY